MFSRTTACNILNEEGRARPVAAASGSDFVTKYIYDYFVKDHLGNVRSTITTQPITSGYLAGYEFAQANIEQLVFENVAPVRDAKPGSTDPDDVMAARLNGHDPSTTIGTSLMLKVMPGDRFSIGVDAVYDGDYTQSNELTGRSVAAALMSTLTGGINYDGTATADIPDNVKTIQTIFNNPNLPSQLDNLMASVNDVNAPKAHLNYLFFDSKMNLVSGSSGAVQVVSGATGWQHLTPMPVPNTGGGVCNTCILTPSQYNGGVVVAPGAGFLVVYIDNQSVGKDVYFDHFMVEHYTSEVLEENHYYPFGLTVTANPNTSVTPQPYKLTTKELESHFDLNSYDFGARQFDMTIPVWYTSDQLAEKHYDISPYIYCGDNPANRIDPTGMTDFTVNIKTGAVAQVGEKNDKADRILKTNAKGEVKLDHKGNAKVAIDKIENGILKDGMNFKTQSNLVEAGGEGQPTVNGVKTFVLKLSGYVGVEIAGSYFTKDGGDNVSDIAIGSYENNTATRSYDEGTNLHRYFHTGEEQNRYSLQGIFHTHPNLFGPNYDPEKRFHPSGEDINVKDRTHVYHPLLQYYLLTEPASYGDPYPDKIPY